VGEILIREGEMTTGNIIILAAYIVGVLLTIHFQGKKINALKTQVTSQNEIMANMQRFMGIFRLDGIEKYVEINRKRVDAEKQEAMKQVEKEIKEKALESIHVIRREYEALLELAMKVVSTPEMLRFARKYLEQMNDDVISKKHLLSLYEENYQAWGKYSDSIIGAMIAPDESRSAFWEASRKGREGQK
jgi:formyltetrahydrofolate synthetase